MPNMRYPNVQNASPESECKGGHYHRPKNALDLATREKQVNGGDSKISTTYTQPDVKER